MGVESKSEFLNNECESTDKEPSIWIFGYGSLCWYPGFEYKNCVKGYIKGYVRRFWQGNTVHRGTVHKPGRVATLVEDEQGVTWGCAYQITGIKALEYLNNRECNLGGYIMETTNFFPQFKTFDLNDKFPVLLYIATKNNAQWLGESSLHDMAAQITECSGLSGHNVEYVLRLAEYIRNEIPEAKDDHLFQLEDLIIKIIKQNGISLKQTVKQSSYKIQYIYNDICLINQISNNMINARNI